MKTVTSFLKQMRLSRMLVVLLAGVVLFLNTACNPGAPKVSGEGSYNERRGMETDLYKTIQPKDESSMNNFSNRDPRFNESGAQAKARALSKESERNLQKVQSAEDIVESYREGRPFGDRVRNVTDRVGDTVESVQDQFVEGSENAAAKARGIAKDVNRGTDRAAENVKDNVRGAARDTQRSLERVGDYVDDKA